MRHAITSLPFFSLVARMAIDLNYSLPLILLPLPATPCPASSCHHLPLITVLSRAKPDVRHDFLARG